MRRIPSGWNGVLAKLGMRRHILRKRHSSAVAGRRLRLESLEQRQLLAITVDNLSDIVDGNISAGQYSLREAILNASPGEIINIAVNGTINLTAIGHAAELVIDKALTINGPGASLLTVNAFDPTPTTKNGDGNRAFTINDVSNGSSPPLVQISGLTITGGDIGANAQEGGAIRSVGLLKLNQCTITGNSAFRGGGVFVAVAGGGPTTSRDVLTLENCLIKDNKAFEGGGLVVIAGSDLAPTADRIWIKANTVVRDNLVDFGGSGNGNGGGLVADLHGATLTIEQSSLLHNRTVYGHGGAAHVTISQNAVLRVFESFIREENTAGGDGAGLFANIVLGSAEIQGSTISGNKTMTGKGGGLSADVHANSELAISQSVVTDNEAGPKGGGVYGNVRQNGNWTITDSAISGNTSADGGGIAAQVNTSAAMHVERSRIDGANEALNRGGGLFADIQAGGLIAVADSVITGNDAGTSLTPNLGGVIPHAGGGVYVFLHTNAIISTPAALTIASSEISANRAGRHGGGVTICAKQTPSPSTTRAQVGLYNSTISGNQAGHTTAGNIGGTGGGVHLAIYPGDYQALDTHFQNVTITGNKAHDGGAVWSSVPVESHSLNQAWLTNSIAAGNTKHDLVTPSNLFGSFNIDATTYNIIGSDNDPANPGTPPTSDHLTHNPRDLLNFAQGNNLFTDHPGLTSLKNHGGITRTHGLLTGSPAINAGSNALAVVPFSSPAVVLATDQRGAPFVRKFGNGNTVDIGAHEVQAPRVIDVIVSSSSADQNYHPPYVFSTHVHNGVPVIGNGNQLRTIPVAAADRVGIRFSEELTNLADTSLTLRGMTTGALQQLAASGGFMPIGGVPTWTFSAALAANQYLITISDAVTAPGGHALDGEWTNPFSLATTNAAVSKFPSGNGTPGGAFKFVFTILPGDASLDNGVNGHDLLIWQQNNGASDTNFWYADWTGDGWVDGADLAIYNANAGRNFSTLVFADFNQDGVVTAIDVSIVSSNQGNMNATFANGDVNGDGVVNWNDFLLLQVQFGLQLSWVA